MSSMSSRDNSEDDDEDPREMNRDSMSLPFYRYRSIFAVRHPISHLHHERKHARLLYRLSASAAALQWYYAVLGIREG